MWARTLSVCFPGSQLVAVAPLLCVLRPAGGTFPSSSRWWPRPTRPTTARPRGRAATSRSTASTSAPARVRRRGGCLPSRENNVMSVWLRQAFLTSSGPPLLLLPLLPLLLLLLLCNAGQMFVRRRYISRRCSAFKFFSVTRMRVRMGLSVYDGRTYVCIPNRLASRLTDWFVVFTVQVARRRTS